jgi:hypothetical protein
VRGCAWLLLLLALVSPTLGQAIQLKVTDRLSDGVPTENNRDNARFQPGDTIYIRAQFANDPVLGNVPVTVIAFNPTLGVNEDVETITLTRVNAAFYRGFVTTSRMPDGLATTLSGNGVLDVRGRHSLAMSIAAIGAGNLAGTYPVAETTRFATLARVAFIEPDSTAETVAAGEIAQFKIGDDLFARVEDDDRNVDPGGVDVIIGGLNAAEIRDGVAAGDREPVNFIESGNDTGVFVGRVPTVFVPALASTVAGTLEKSPSPERAFAQYRDQEFPSVAVPVAATRSESIPVRVGAAPPDVAVDILSFASGDGVQVQVLDRALNQPNALPTSTVTVSVVAFNGAAVAVDAETLVLASVDGTTFRGRVPWAFGAAPVVDDGLLRVPVGGSANAFYSPVVGPVGEPSFQVMRAAVFPAPAVVSQIDFATGPDGVAALPAGTRVARTDTLYLRVIDLGLVDKPISGVSQVLASVTVNPHANVQPVVLRELANTPGTFVGAVPLTDLDPSAVANGTVRVRGNDTLSATATSSSGGGLLSANDPVVATVPLVQVQQDPGLTATNDPPEERQEVRRIRAGDVLYVVVRDDDRNAAIGARDMVAVVITTTGGADSDTVNLLETGNDTGVFAARVPTRFASGPVNDGIVSARGDGGNAGVDEIAVTYTDPSLPAAVGPAFVARVDVEIGVNATLNPAGAVNPGAPVQVLIVYNDAGANATAGPGNDSVRVTLTSRNAAAAVVDQESIDANELGDPLAAGDFRASVPALFGLASPIGDGAIRVEAGGTLTVGYVEGLRLSGETRRVLEVVLTVTDADANRTAGVDTVTVSVTTSAPANDVESVVLVEQAPGVFRGTLATRFARTPVNNNGQLDVRGVDAPAQVTAAYASPSGALVNATVRVDIDGLIDFVDNGLGAKRPALTALAGDPLFVLLEDDDLDTTAAADTINVVIRSFADTGAGIVQIDAETFALTETGARTGVFTSAGIPTRFRAIAGAGVANVVDLNDTGGGFVTAEYTDADNQSGAPVVRPTRQLPVAGGVQGTVDAVVATGAAPLTPLSGGVRVIVLDDDASAAPVLGTGNDSVRVTLTSFVGAVLVDEETVEVTEVGAPSVLAPGRFERIVPVVFRAAGTGRLADGTLEVRSGGTVLAGYTDRLGGAGQRDEARESLSGPLAVAFTGNARTVTFPADLNGTGARARIAPGDQLLVRVADDDANFSPDPDVVTVALTTALGAGAALEDAESVRLVETGPSTGVFTGAIATKFGLTVLDANGQLEVRGRDVPGGAGVRATYTSPAGGAPVVVDLPVDVDGDVIFVAGSAGPGQARVFSFRAGDRLFVQVTDDDLNANPTLREPFDVTVRSFNNGGTTLVDQETVTLTEDEVNAGLFLGPALGFLTAFVAPGGGIAGNNTLEVNDVGGGVVTVDYGDNANPSGVPVLRTDTINLATASGAASAPGVVEAVNGRESAAALVRRISPGNTLYVRVTDSDQAPLQAGQTASVSVTVVAGTGADADTEVVTLTASDAGSVFTGEIQTRFGETQRTNARGVTLRDPGNGVLEVRGRDQIQLRYNDRAPAVTVVNATPLDVETDGRVRGVGVASQGAGAITTVTVGMELCVEVEDDDLNADRAVANTATVVAATSAGGLADSELVTVRETGPDTGVFVGCVITRAGQPTAVANDGVLDTSGSAARTRAANFTVTYDDQRVPFPAPAALAAPVSKSVALDAAFGSARPPSSGTITLGGTTGGLVRAGERGRLVGGSPLLIVVTDPDADVSPAADMVTVRVQVSSSIAGADALDVETVRLIETGGSTGVFGPANLGTVAPCNGSVRDGVPTNFGPRTLNDCNVTVAGGEFVFVQYLEERDATGAVPPPPADRLQVVSRYLTELVATNATAGATRLDLPNRARLEIQTGSVYRPLEITFEVRFGDDPPGVSTILDESNNTVPLPLTRGLRLVRLPGERAFWYEIRPSGTQLRKPGQLLVPVPVDIRSTGSGEALAAIASRLRIVFFDGLDWVSVGGTFIPRGTDITVPDPLQDYVSTTLNHFTTFALAVDERTPPPVGGPLISHLAIDNNPFSPNRDSINDVATISFGLAEPSSVTVKVFDSSGALVRTLVQDVRLSAGFVSEQWNGSYLFADRIVPTGLYVIEVEATAVGTGRRARETTLVGVVR